MGRSPVDYPRELAVRVLTRVLSGGEALDEVLSELSGQVPPVGRAWLQEICSGTLRWKGRIDQILDTVALKKKPSGWLRRVLSIGVYQLIGQERTSPVSVVSETVDLIKKKEGLAPSRFANALLRKVADHSKEWAELAPPAGATGEQAARWASLPIWLWSRLVAERGETWARAYALASLERPTLWLRGRAPDWHPTWAEAGPTPGSFKLKAGAEGGSIAQRPGFSAGEFFVQDISSQYLISEVSGMIHQARGSAVTRSLRALDLCAAPGGKSAGLNAAGFAVTATDLGEARVALLRDTIERVAPEVGVVAREEVSGLPAFDLVWVDAPCSGSGILRRHPDVRWLKKETDLASLHSIQRELLQAGFAQVKAGGYLVYSVCSVLRQEGPDLLSQAGLGGRVLHEWLLGPHEAPFGDGFWATLVQKT